MLKIGDFSKMAMVSVRMLRYYDEHGLLSPVRIDPESGYRYYEVSQLAEVQEIKLLQRFGVRLADIRSLKENGFLPERMLPFLRNCLTERQNALAELSRDLRALEKTIGRLERNEKMTDYTITLKTIPARTVASLRAVIDRYADEGKLWETLYARIAQNGIVLEEPCFPAATYPDGEYKEQNPEIEVEVTVKEPCRDAEGISIRKREELTAACVTFTGPYDQINGVYRSIAQWMETEGYDFAGNMFLRYLRSPSETTDENDLLSELCVPVRKR